VERREISLNDNEKKTLKRAREREREKRED